jgi:hypothetical protein
MMRQSAELRSRLRGGNLIGDRNLLIRDRAVDLTLVTRNRRHFERVFELDLYQDS